jgi:hypothetical protein
MEYIVLLAVIAASIWVVIKSNMAVNWHNRGVGERKARAEYGRLQRKEPESPGAGLSESEFVESFVSAKPKAGRYILYAILLLFLGLPASCVLVMNR